MSNTLVKRASARLSTLPVLYLRLVLGLAQGLALYLLIPYYDEPRDFPGYALLLSIFLPLILIQGMTSLRTLTLLAWTATAGFLIILFLSYDIYRGWPVDRTAGNGGGDIISNAAMIIALPVLLFIAHALIIGSDAERRWRASYQSHFDTAWQMALQIGLTLLFVGVMWGVLHLGAALFNILALDFLKKTILEPLFSIPFTTLAVALGLHLSDAQASLTRGARILLLRLLSWLLPLAAALGFAFLVALVIAGPEPLWKTSHATPLLLVAGAGLIILINAAYGAGEEEMNRALRFFCTLAVLCLVPFGLTAAWATGLRVEQYGWTPERIYAATLIGIGGIYALGYAGALVLSRPSFSAGWLKKLEDINFVGGLAIVTAIILLFTPLLDPLRISVNSQMKRLERGEVAPEKFDLAFLRFDGGRFGRQALEKLAADAKTHGDEKMVERVDTIVKSTHRYADSDSSAIPFAERVRVYPQGATLPDDFVVRVKETDLSVNWLCRSSGQGVCEARLADVDNDGTTEILIFTDYFIYVYAKTGVDKHGAQKEWREAHSWQIPSSCASVQKALREGRFSFKAPLKVWPDLEIAGQRFIGIVQPSEGNACPTNPE
jgi:hypothetical protein